MSKKNLIKLGKLELYNTIITIEDCRGRLEFIKDYIQKSLKNTASKSAVDLVVSTVRELFNVNNEILQQSGKFFNEVYLRDFYDIEKSLENIDELEYKLVKVNYTCFDKLLMYLEENTLDLCEFEQYLEKLSASFNISYKCKVNKYSEKKIKIELSYDYIIEAVYDCNSKKLIRWGIKVNNKDYMKSIHDRRVFGYIKEDVNDCQFNTEYITHPNYVSLTESYYPRRVKNKINPQYSAPNTLLYNCNINYSSFNGTIINDENFNLLVNEYNKRSKPSTRIKSYIIDLDNLDTNKHDKYLSFILQTSRSTNLRIFVKSKTDNLKYSNLFGTIINQSDIDFDRD